MNIISRILYSPEFDIILIFNDYKLTYQNIVSDFSHQLVGGRFSLVLGEIILGLVGGGE